MRENLTILRTASSCGASHVPSQPLTIPSPRTTHCRDSGLPHDTRNIMGLQETFLNDYLLEEDHPRLSPKNQRIWHHLLADWDLRLQDIQWYRKVNRDGNRRILQYLYHASKEEVEYFIILVELFLTVVWWITRDFLSRKIPTMEFPSWKVNFNTEVCSKISRSSSHNALDQRNWDSKVNRRTCDIEIYNAANRFPEYDMFDAMIASALEKLLHTHVHFRKRVSVEEQRAENTT